ncbi:MAG: hypothetical protein ACERKS_13160 [Candidatus Bathyarchaeota archaeon]
MGHYYTDNPPAPFYEIEYADKKRAGEFRPVTIKDARRVGAYPSPNEVMGILDKPGLLYWKQQMLAEAVRDTVLDLAGDWDEFAWSQAYSLFKARTAIFAQQGTEIHDMIEQCLISDGTYEPDLIVDACVDWLHETGIKWTGVEEVFVSPEIGIGGKIDVVDDTVPAIIDWKTIDTRDKKFRPYTKDKTPLLAAYAMGRFGVLEVDCWNVFISRDEPGKIIPKLYTPEEIEYGWQKFELCYYLWVLDKGYDPRKDVTL